MTRYDRRSIVLAIGLSTLAGYVDAIGFLLSGRFFVSFMSGNSTRLGVDLGSGALTSAVVLTCVVLLFITGVVVGNLVQHQSEASRRTAVLILVAGLLALSAAFFESDRSSVGTALLLLGMGAENAVFRRDGEVSIGLTYITGALVKMGQRLAAAIRGGSRWEWVPYSLLWVGLVGGAALGTFVQTRLVANGLWGAVVLALSLSAFSARTRNMS
ncbi:DUF1275 domain-containing protein [bacterium]|nr:MAG: DUF1275 domain-containing protein [bacterium]